MTDDFHVHATARPTASFHTKDECPRKAVGTPDCDCVPGHRCDCWDYRTDAGILSAVDIKMLEVDLFAIDSTLDRILREPGNGHIPIWSREDRRRIHHWLGRIALVRADARGYLPK